MRLGQWISVIALLISLYIMWRIRQVLLLVFGAAVFATVLNRVVRRLQLSGVKRGIAIAITLLIVFVTLAGFFLVIVPKIGDQVQQFTSLLPQGIEQLRTGYEWLQSRIPGRVLEDNRSVSALLQNLQTWTSRLLGNFWLLVSNSVSAAVSLLLFLAITIMLLLDPLQYRRVFVMAFPAFYRRRVEEILDQCEHSLVGWSRGTLLAMVAIAIVSYIGLLILGVPLPLVNALIAGLLEFIPNIGPTLSIIPPTLLALLDAPWKAVGVIVLYLLIQQFESLILVPLVMKHEASLLPLFTVLAVVVSSIFFGFLGLFLAVPLLVVVQIWLKEVLVEDILNQWKGDEKLEKPEQIPADIAQDHGLNKT
ncbi:MAG: AI-2E family transporter [Leptolyngbyaceae cyanobacterium SM1_4_3]|nr:AI-2E family transporter [Leptolyngbyaceae cyanobacterium SM1_4_3]